jgi:hypothetical protein
MDGRPMTTLHGIFWCELGILNRRTGVDRGREGWFSALLGHISLPAKARCCTRGHSLAPPLAGMSGAVGYPFSAKQINKL